MKLYSIASGSSGNSIFVGSGSTGRGVLIDTGISKKRMEEGLSLEHMSFEDVDGIFITHEHSDHISGLGPVLRKYRIPVYATERTIRYILENGKCGKVENELFQCVKPDVPVSVGGMEVMPFSVSHDAADPVCYTVREGQNKVAVATDMGEYTDYTFSHLEDCDGILIEANHDINMLQVGPYPYYLKQRILGDRGHLSNEASGKLLGRLLNDHMKAVVLGHLSKENNLPELAYETVKVEVMTSGTGYNVEDFPIYVARRNEVSQMIEI